MQHRPVTRPDRNPFAGFRREHRGVLGRLDRLELAMNRKRPSAGAETLLRATMTHLERQFGTHMAAEDAVLFPTVAAGFPEMRETIAPLADEHVTLRAMLATLRQTLDRPRDRARGEQLLVQARDLVDLLRIHIEKEDAILFPLAERILQPRGVLDLARRLRPFRTPDRPTPSHRTPPRPSKGSSS